MRKASKVASLGCPCCFINNPLLSSGKNSKTVLIRQLWNIEIALKPNTLSDEGRSTEPSYENVSVEVVAFIQKKALVSSARAFYFQTYGKNWYLLSTFVWSSGQWIHISFYHFARGRVCPLSGVSPLWHLGRSGQRGLEAGGPGSWGSKRIEKIATNSSKSSLDLKRKVLGWAGFGLLWIAIWLTALESVWLLLYLI